MDKLNVDVLLIVLVQKIEISYVNVGHVPGLHIHMLTTVIITKEAKVNVDVKPIIIAGTIKNKNH